MTSLAASMRSAAFAVTDEEPYEPVVTPPARRALTDLLPEAVAAAAIDFLAAALISNPRRVGKPLRGELDDIWWAWRGTYRVLYRIRENPREVVAARVHHQREIYRPR